MERFSFFLWYISIYLLTRRQRILFWLLFSSLFCALLDKYEKFFDDTVIVPSVHHLEKRKKNENAMSISLSCSFFLLPFVFLSIDINCRRAALMIDECRHCSSRRVLVIVCLVYNCTLSFDLELIWQIGLLREDALFANMVNMNLWLPFKAFIIDSNK